MTHSDIPPAVDPVAPTSHAAVIGLDIGGTKTRGVRFEGGTAVADESVGSSNVQNVSREEAALHLAELFARNGGGTVAQVYAVAGVMHGPHEGWSGGPAGHRGGNNAGTKDVVRQDSLLGEDSVGCSGDSF